MTATPVYQRTHKAVIEQVRLLWLANGGNLTQACKTANVPIDRAEKWKERQNWSLNALESKQMMTSENVGAIADSLASELAEAETQSRISLARSVKRLAKDSEDVTLRDSGHVYTVAKTAAIVHKWDQKSPQANVMVNIALLGVDPGEVQATAHTLDDEA